VSGGAFVKIEEFVSILNERVHVGDSFGNTEQPGTFFTVDSISNSAVMFKRGGQIIKISFANSVDILNEFSGGGLSDLDLHGFMPNKFNPRYRYYNGICLLWLFAKMGLTKDGEVWQDYYESGAPMYYINLS
jgi:hypothetical protein